MLNSRYIHSHLSLTAATLAKEAKQIVLENLSKLQQAGTQAKDKAVGKTAGLLDLGALPELSNFKSAIEVRSSVQSLFGAKS